MNESSYALSVASAAHNASSIQASDMAAMLNMSMMNQSAPFQYSPSWFDFGVVVFAVLTFILGIVGNSLVIYAVVCNSHMRTVTNIFIVNLAIGDFLVILLCLPPTIANYVTSQWWFGQAMCKFIIYIQYVSVCISVMTLTSISYERYYAIVYPLKFQATKFRAKIMILIIWVLSFMICVSQPIVLVEKTESGITFCYPEWNPIFQNIFNLGMFIVLYILPIILIIYTYSQVVAVLWTVDKNIAIDESESSVSNKLIKSQVKQSKLQRDGSTHGTNRPRSYSNQSCNLTPLSGLNSTNMAVRSKLKNQLIARRKAAKMLICVAFMFAACNLPIHILNILRFMEMVHLLGDYVFVVFKISHCLFYVNSCINPLIYYFMSDNFRKEFRKVLFCLKFSKSTSMHSAMTETSSASRKFSNGIHLRINHPSNHNNANSSACHAQLKQQNSNSNSNTPLASNKNQAQRLSNKSYRSDTSKEAVSLIADSTLKK